MALFIGSLPETDLPAETPEYRHQHVDQHRRQRRAERACAARAQHRSQHVRHERAADRVDQSDEDGGDEGAADRADATDDNDDKSEDQDVLAHADLHHEDRRLHQAGEAGERGAEPEHQRVEQLDIDAERADHFAVRCTSADQHAEPGAHDREIQQRSDRQRYRDNDQAIDRIIDAGNHLNGVEHLARQRQRHSRRTPDQAHQVVEENQDAERAEHVVEMVAAVEWPDRDDFQHDARNECRGKSEYRADHEAVGRLGERRGKIGAEHVERAVRQVDEVHDAEDQRQARREQEQQHAKLHAVEALLDEIQHRLVSLAIPRPVRP
jgi:hypothetical protein